MNDFSPCDEVNELLSAYYDGELDPKQTKFVKKHLRECLVCRLELEKLKRLSLLIKSSYSASPLLLKRKQHNMRRMISSSIAALVFFVCLGWFSIVMVTSDKPPSTNTEKPMYVNSQLQQDACLSVIQLECKGN